MACIRQVVRVGAIWLLVCLLGLSVWLGGNVSAALAAPEPITLSQLQQRLEHPVKRAGQVTLDLSQLTLDLRNENTEFREQFYRSVQKQLVAGSVAIGLDLSHSLIRGDLDLQRLGLRTPLYGESLAGVLPPEASDQLSRDRNRLAQLSQLSQSLLIQTQTASQNIVVFRGLLNLVQTTVTGRLTAADTYFLSPVDATNATFRQSTNWSGSRFIRSVSFASSQFQQDSSFRNSLFFGPARFNQSGFNGEASFQNAEFRTLVYFNQANFANLANLSRTHWFDNADLAQTHFYKPLSFAKAQFDKALFLTEAKFEAAVIFRQAQFSQPVNLRGAAINSQADFGDASFAKAAYINAADMEFNAEQAQILGTPGQIGAVFSVPTLAGNETVLRNLVRNFRQLEQISDANQIEYTAERLRLRFLFRQLQGVNLNSAPARQLSQLGFGPEQVSAIIRYRTTQPFKHVADLLNLDEIDLAAYVKVRDRIVTRDLLSFGRRSLMAFQCLGLGLLLVLSNYGTSVDLVFGLGLLAIAQFGLMYWLIDRYRRRLPTPIVPPLYEIICMGSSFVMFVALGWSCVDRSSQALGWSIGCFGLITLPIPLGLIVTLYRRGRFHDLMESSYFVQDGSFRQILLLIARLPVIPKFPFFRDRYTPLLLDRRWNWLNYYDFSLNNWLKFGFNDTRMRDQALPGLISTLVWYQWALGVLYIALLLWTLSRTIPGLNLLLYF
jgi:Helix-hairpin-helix motif/Pentapeptide repeats (9 copies)